MRTEFIVVFLLLVDSTTISSKSSKPTIKPSRVPSIKPKRLPTTAPVKRPSAKPTVKPRLPSSQPSQCPITSFGSLGSFPFCPSVVPLAGYAYDFDFSDPIYPFVYLDKADTNNGFNEFITPVPSIVKEVPILQGTTTVYFVCSNVSRVVMQKDIYFFHSHLLSVTIESSSAPKLCAALAAKAAVIATAAPSVFVKLPCLNITVPALPPASFPMCDVFLNPDDSYKCLGGGISIGFGGNDRIGASCNFQTIGDTAWAYVTGPETDPFVGAIGNPYPAIRAIAYGFYFDTTLYVACGNATEYKGGAFDVLTVSYTEAPELCKALGVGYKPTIKPSLVPLIKPKRIPTAAPVKRPSAKPTVKPRLPSSQPSQCPITSFGSLGSFPFCPSVVPLAGYAYDFDFSDPIYPFVYLDKADTNNGFNEFITPVPSIVKEVPILQGTTTVYFVCSNVSRVVMQKDIYFFSHLLSVTIESSSAPKLCAALAAKAAVITTAAPSVFVKLPCLNITVPALPPASFPMCDVFLNPDDSYKCLGGGISIGFGGNDRIGASCNFQTIGDTAWAYVTGPETDPFVGAISNPYPAIRAIAYGFYFDTTLYVACGNATEYKGGAFDVLTVSYTEAPELCKALGVGYKPTIKPSRVPSIKPKRIPTTAPVKRPSAKPTVKPRLPSAQPSQCPITSFGSLGNFPFCPSVVPLEGYAYDFDFSDPIYPFVYLDKADTNNGFNEFITPVPSIVKEVPILQGTTTVYFVCSNVSRVVMQKDIYFFHSHLLSVTIESSSAPKLCAALAAKAAVITTAAPSVFVKLPCLNITVPALPPASFPMCDVFLNPDDSYKCLGGGISIGFGGNDRIGASCNFQTIGDTAWAYVTGPETDPFVGAIGNPYPAIRAIAYGWYIDTTLYVACGNATQYKGGAFDVLTVSYTEAPELCKALGFNS